MFFLLLIFKVLIFELLVLLGVFINNKVSFIKLKLIDKDLNTDDKDFKLKKLKILEKKESEKILNAEKVCFISLINISRL
jgi:hypothetical protein